VWHRFSESPMSFNRMTERKHSFPVTWVNWYLSLYLFPWLLVMSREMFPTDFTFFILIYLIEIIFLNLWWKLVLDRWYWKNSNYLSTLFSVINRKPDQKFEYCWNLQLENRILGIKSKFRILVKYCSFDHKLKYWSKSKA